MKSHYLQQLTLFHQLTEAAIQWLDQHIALRGYPPGAYIYFSTPDIPQIYLIKQGHVQIGYLDLEGREFILDLLGPDSFFGTLSLGMGAESFARSVTKTELFVMQEKDFWDVLKRHPDLALQVIRRQWTSIRFLEGKIQDIVFRDVQYRVCQLLFTCYRRFGNVKTGYLEVPLTHQEIANLVGCSREAASNCLSELKKQGVIDYGKRYIKIAFPQKLQARCSSLAKE